MERDDIPTFYQGPSFPHAGASVACMKPHLMLAIVVADAELTRSLSILQNILPWTSTGSSKTDGRSCYNNTYFGLITCRASCERLDIVLNVPPLRMPISTESGHPCQYRNSNDFMDSNNQDTIRYRHYVLSTFSPS